MTMSMTAQQVEPDAELKKLDRLVGTWKLEGETFDDYGKVQGQVTFEWLEGGFFLVQHVDINHKGSPVKGIEVIGREKKFGDEAPSKDIRSRFYDNMGNTFDYVYELKGDELTVWGGEVGSPANMKARFSADGKTATGRWEWPGGGYSVNLTRIK